MENLNMHQEKLRNVYLSNLAKGKILGPPVGIPSIDKKWLRFYSEEQIMAEMPQSTIYEYMLKKNKDNLDAPALYYYNKKITYRKLNILIDTCANGLIKNGVKKGDIVTVCMPNTPEAVISFYALNKIGAIANMIHPLSGQNEIKEYLKEAESKIVITIDLAYSKIESMVKETSIEKMVVVSPVDSMMIPTFVKKFYTLSQPVENRAKESELVISWPNFMKKARMKKDEIIIGLPYESNRQAVMLHTGGTTGKPKGVVLTDDNVNAMVEQFIQDNKDFARGDKVLTIMPVFHGFGLCSSVHLPLSVGVASVLIPKFNAKKFDKTLKKYKPNHIIGVPTLFKAMLNNKKIQKMDLSFLKYVVSGGDTIHKSFEKEINVFLKVHHSKAILNKGYGLSEAVAGVTFASKDYNLPNSIGIPMVATDIKVVSTETKKEVSEKEIGELCVKSPSVMVQYYKNQKESLEALRDGWLHTGDLGFNKNGVFYFVQRRGNMIVSSGVNVYPTNIEQVIEMHEAVDQCMVVGIHHPYKLEVPMAIIKLKEGYENSEQIQMEIDSLCRENLNIYSVPNVYEFRKELSETLLGKKSYKQLQKKI